MGTYVQGLFWTIQKCKTKRKRITLIVLRPTATFLEGAIVIVPPPVHSMNVFPLAVRLSFQFVNLAMLVIVSGGSDCNSVSLRTLYDLIPHPKDIISMFNSLSAVAVKSSDSPLMDPHRHHTVVSNICELELERLALSMLAAIRDFHFPRWL